VLLSSETPAVAAGRLSALENPADVDAGATAGIAETRSVAHQAAEFDVFARDIDRGQCVARGQRDQLPASCQEHCATANEQRISARLHDPREGGIELAFTCHFHDQNLPPDGDCRRLDLRLGRGWPAGRRTRLIDFYDMKIAAGIVFRVLVSVRRRNPDLDGKGVSAQGRVSCIISPQL
jgi:hypothetical protein